jgi:hypothetical protein
MDEENVAIDSAVSEMGERLRSRHTKLGVVVSGSSDQLLAGGDQPTIDLNKELTEALLNVPAAKRPRIVSELLGDMVANKASLYVCLTGLEILFEPSLQIQAADLLKQLAHDHIILVVWPGDYVKSERGGKLSYSELGHVEYQAYTITTEDDFEVISYQNLIKDTA